MNGETVLRNVWHVMRGHQKVYYGKKPLFLYISYRELMYLKQTEEFVIENGPTYAYDEPQPLKIFGMEIVRVSRQDDFIRVGN